MQTFTCVAEHNSHNGQISKKAPSTVKRGSWSSCTKLSLQNRDFPALTGYTTDAGQFGIKTDQSSYWQAQLRCDFYKGCRWNIKHAGPDSWDMQYWELCLLHITRIIMKSGHSNCQRSLEEGVLPVYQVVCLFLFLIMFLSSSCLFLMGLMLENNLSL